MTNTTAVAPEQHFILSALSPGAAQKRFAAAVTVALLSAFIVTAGLRSRIQLPRIDAFIPAYATAMLVTDSVTAILLFAQFSILRSRALLVIASGYLFTALIVIPWTLTFPGVFAPTGLLGSGLQSTSVLYILWHAGFACFVIAYAVLKEAEPTERLSQASVTAAIVSSVGMTVVGVCAATFVVTMYDAALPHLMLDMVRLGHRWFYAAGFAALLSAFAIGVLWIRGRSVLDLWLGVVMCAYVMEIFLISFPVPVRFSIGWYVGRVFGLLSGSIVLLVLLYEITTLYAQLLRALFAQRREREARLMTGDTVAASIAHEVNQPLTGMISRANAGLRWLARGPPDLAKVENALQQIVADGHRAGAVIAGIRAMFKRDARTRVSLDINDLVAEALALLVDELSENRIVVEIALRSGLPQVMGDPTQLRQVVLNLIANAIDAMAASNGTRVLSLRSEPGYDGAIAVTVADTGVGIPTEKIERIFNPLFTTKSGGMGMGLSICRTIIEAHDGELTAVPNNPRGAVFRFVLHADKATFAEGAPARAPAP